MYDLAGHLPLFLITNNVLEKHLPYTAMFQNDVLKLSSSKSRHYN